MKKIYMIIFFLVGVCSANGQGTWTQKANFGGIVRYDAVSFSIGNKGYIGTGLYYQDFWEWDQALNVWTQKADFGGGGRDWATGFSIGNKGYIGTGYDGSGNKTNDFWEWDQATNVWTQKASLTGGARFLAVGFAIGNKGYIGTGDAGPYLNDFWEYDPLLDTWVQKANFGGGSRMWAVGFSIGNKGYIGAGQNTSSTCINDFWEYDPSLDTWTQKANLGGVARYAPVGFSMGTKGYIGLGESLLPNTFYSDFWEWDQSTNLWVQRTNFSGGIRSRAVGFSIGSLGYVGTGYDGSNSFNDFWVFTSCGAVAPPICMVTTDSSSNYNYNVVEWDKTSYSNVDSFIIYRKDAISSNYLRIGAVSKNALSEFVDTAFNIGGPNGGNPQYSSWFYKLAIRVLVAILMSKALITNPCLFSKVVLIFLGMHIQLKRDK